MLFRGTVAENIALGAPASRVGAAARMAGAHEFIERLESGYETVVGDGGTPLSAGETRRLALARAFARDAPLLILDEPTAHLDRESAQLIHSAITDRAGERTILLITHDIALASHAEQQVCLSAGQVVAQRVEAAA
jgi:ABC-type multidrug transport system fused ATPase/permease subunit